MKKRRKLRRKYRRNEEGAGESSPARVRASELTDLAYTIGAGFGGYAVTRFASRAVQVQVAKTSYAKHAKLAGALGAVAGAAAAWLGSRYWEKVADHHDAITIGAGIGALQTTVQLMLPQYAWIVSDVKIEDPAAKPALDLDKILDDHDLEVSPIKSTEQLKAAELSDLSDSLPPEWAFGTSEDEG